MPHNPLDVGTPIEEDEAVARWPHVISDDLLGFYAPGEWRSIVEDLMDEIFALTSMESDCPIRIVQVKEKIGGLRVYTEGDDGATPLMKKAVRYAIYIAQKAVSDISFTRAAFGMKSRHIY